MRFKSIYKSVAAIVATTAAFTSPFTVPRAEAAALEEVVVTARKREESLQDVPISVQAYSGDSIADQGLVDMQAMAASIPNFSYSQAVGASDVLIMRGLGTVGSGPHLEQAVGQVFNGYFTTRSRMGRAALIDLAQVEVLRGPQGPIVGKNTSLGAVMVTSKKPTEEAEFIISGGYDFEASEGYEVQGIASGPLSDTFRARAMLDYKDKEGWTVNAPTGDGHRAKDDLTARLILDWDISDSISAEFLAQLTDYDQEGKPREMFCLNPAAVAADPRFAGEDCTINGRNNSRATLAGSRLGTGVDQVVEEGFQLEGGIYGATINWDFDTFTVSSLTSFTEYEMTDLFDSDLTSAGGALGLDNRVIENFEDYEQFTQEFRIVSNGGDRFDYIAGINYFDSDMFFTQDFDHHTGNVARRHEVAQVETESISAFGQIDWHLADQWNLTTGLRWTDEQRDSFKDQWQTAYGDETNTRRDDLCRTGGLNGCFMAPLTGEVDDSAVSWNLALQWSYSDNSMLYFSAASGFKSAGFNIRANVNNAAAQQNFVFDEEESVNFEIGGKHDLLDGSLRFNWTIFNTEIDGIQLSANDPVNISQSVVNGDASAVGVEFDLLWAATDAWTLGLTGAFTKTEYDEFLGDCWTVPSQSEAQGCDVDVNGDGNPDFQDQKGAAPPFAPDFTIALTSAYVWEVGPSSELTFRVKVYTVDEQTLSVNRHPISEEDGYTKFDASLMLSDIEGKWKVSLVGRNLGDELVRSWSEPTTAFNSVGGGHYAFIDETRAVAVRGEYRF